METNLIQEDVKNEIFINEKNDVKLQQSSSAVDFVNSLIQEKGIFNACKILSETTLLPTQYRNPASIMIALDMCERTGLSLFAVTNNLNIINGKPSWSAQAVISMVKNYYNNKNLKVRHTFVGAEDTEEFGCRIEVYDAEDNIVEQGTDVTLKLAKSEGWLKNPTSKWHTMPKQMLIYRAYSFFARTHTPELLMGFNHTDDELRDVNNSMTSNPYNPFDGDEEVLFNGK